MIRLMRWNSSSARSSIGPCMVCLWSNCVRVYVDPSADPLTSRASPDIYYQAGFSDNKPLRALVYFVFIFETVQTILLTHDTFHELAINFGDYEGLLNPYYIWFDLPVQSAIRVCYSPFCASFLTSVTTVSSITQCFYAWRILVLSKSHIIAASIVLVSVTLFSTISDTHVDAVVTTTMCRGHFRRSRML